MDLKEFIEALPYPVFAELQKVMVIRHSREAAELMKVILYLKDNNTLKDVIEANPHELIEHLMGANECGPEVCLRALDRFVALKQQEEAHDGESKDGESLIAQLDRELRGGDKKSEP